MPDCTSVVTHSRVKVEENRRKAVFRNPQRKNYEVTQIDGCLITNGVRADYLVSEVSTHSILIELKGVNVEHACAQLLTTVQRGEMRPLLYPKLGFLVICSRYPRFDTFVAKAKQQCANRYKAGFHIVCDQGEFDIHRVAAIDGPR